MDDNGTALDIALMQHPGLLLVMFLASCAGALAAAGLIHLIVDRPARRRK